MLSSDNDNNSMNNDSDEDKDKKGKNKASITYSKNTNNNNSKDKDQKKTVLPQPQKQSAPMVGPEVFKVFRDKTIVITGLFKNIERATLENLVKDLGAKLTGSVSGRTNYLFYGYQLEDGRPVETGKKF